MKFSLLLRSEIRKLTSTKMPLVFLIVLIIFGVLNAVAIITGTDMDGSKAFISTAADQQSLISFAANAMILTSLFGAIAVAREYGHGTVVPTFLTVPRRQQAVFAQLSAVALGGAIIGFLGSVFIALALAIALPSTEFGFLIPNSDLLQVILAATIAGAVGSVLGAGIGSIVRNTGGAVTGVFLALIVAPPLIVQLANSTGAWMPGSLTNVASGITNDVSITSAYIALLVWAVVPAVVGLITTLRRDIV
jgi:hypothetical protein